VRKTVPTKYLCFVSPSVGGATTTGQMVVSDPDSEEDEDDDQEKRHSSDSEDDLASLPRIRQLPETTNVSKAAAAEDMDVSSTDGINLFCTIEMCSFSTCCAYNRLSVVID
jgi:hypothetical protein